MALTKIESSSGSGAGSTATPPKTIAVRSSSNSTNLLYTVPVGRKFTGWCGSFTGGTGTWFFLTPSGETVNNGSTSIQKYGSAFIAGQTGNNYWQTDLPFTLHAGDMIHSNNNGGSSILQVFGEETDV